MSVRFKIVVLICFLSIKLFSSDILLKNILIYNKIDPNPVVNSKPDSLKIFYPINIFKNNTSIKKSNQIIYKKTTRNNNFFFILLLFLAILCSLVRFSFINNFNIQFINFFKLKNKEIEEYQFIKKIFFNIVFLSFVGYLIYLLLSTITMNYMNNISILYMLIFVVTIYITIKNSILFIISKIFSLDKLYKTYQYIINDMISIFIVIGLPVFLLQTIAITQFKTTMLLFLIFILIFMYVFSFVKVIFNNIQLISTNFTNTIIYFIAIELIPLILFAKFINLNILH